MRKADRNWEVMSQNITNQIRPDHTVEVYFILKLGTPYWVVCGTLSQPESAGRLIMMAWPARTMSGCWRNWNWSTSMLTH